MGENTFEEINVEPADTPGRNYGWKTVEGTACFEATTCDTSSFIASTLTYGRDFGCAVTGGYVYRGQRIPGLRGTCLYADFCTGNIGSFRMNHLHPPFNNVKVRQAVMTALSQQDYMTALVGNDPNLWKTMGGFFTPGTPLYTEEGGEMMKAANMERGRQMLRESGYAGEPVICLVAQDQPITKAQGDVTADLLRRLGMNVEYVATDWGTVGQRRAMKNPPNQGGWGMFHTWHAGADATNPLSYNAVRASGDRAWFGWPDVPAVEAEVPNWLAATSLEQEREVIGRLNAAAVENVVYCPTGFFMGYQAWRRNVSGIVKGPIPFAWGVSKS